ncbi:hypothetical protein [Pseudolactococcus insecticola]|uniref:Uncharacterized protein n=1 Tax=Pseudolactococcus insecticola TaxID=2709158 RepID=A0A6A0B7T4_9LACT|nr:hypothetical protein [Lactococcus insecticola]GFH40845.1 hypothetical protein Hs20B_12430 [Lactococcus insecticola]
MSHTNIPAESLAEEHYKQNCEILSYYQTKIPCEHYEAIEKIFYKQFIFALSFDESHFDKHLTLQKFSEIHSEIKKIYDNLDLLDSLEISNNYYIQKMLTTL